MPACNKNTGNKKHQQWLSWKLHLLESRLWWCKGKRYKAIEKARADLHRRRAKKMLKTACAHP